MKIHEFGLWFNPCYSDVWLTTIPSKISFQIFYDGRVLGEYYASARALYLYIHHPHKIHLKSKFSKSPNDWFVIGRDLTLEDFEIILNPDYKEIP